ncbi:nucleoside diphosphate-linked moiety X motif 6 [Clonorchis sinensis]|uniref:Nucleoside diphosphate-linked moiety X motif 6 n=1 Tax=Clonorchis sinensis TaxID=79923 RepID=G7YBE6_CLOSI|nr:nucleoside diphosphate-linked moiety X motif 6 [Clonorchis sinensis]
MAYVSVQFEDPTELNIDEHKLKVASASGWLHNRTRMDSAMDNILDLMALMTALLSGRLGIVKPFYTLCLWFGIRFNGWKFPTGLAHLGEDISSAVLRELYEETGILAKFSGILALRQQHAFPGSFGRSDFLVACRLRLPSACEELPSVRPCKKELSDGMWMPMTKLRSAQVHSVIKDLKSEQMACSENIHITTFTSEILRLLSPSKPASNALELRQHRFESILGSGAGIVSHLQQSGYGDYVLYRMRVIRVGCRSVRSLGSNKLTYYMTHETEFFLSVVFPCWLLMAVYICDFKPTKRQLCSKENLAYHCRMLCDLHDKCICILGTSSCLLILVDARGQFSCGLRSPYRRIQVWTSRLLCNRNTSSFLCILVQTFSYTGFFITVNRFATFIPSAADRETFVLRNQMKCP